MDPNATLALIRKLVTECSYHEDAVTAAQEGDSGDEEYEAFAIAFGDFVQLVTLVQGLDGWMSSGGFPPTAWERKP